MAQRGEKGDAMTIQKSSTKAKSWKNLFVLLLGHLNAHYIYTYIFIFFSLPFMTYGEQLQGMNGGISNGGMITHEQAYKMANDFNNPSSLHLSSIPQQPTPIPSITGQEGKIQLILFSSSCSKRNFTFSAKGPQHPVVLTE